MTVRIEYEFAAVSRRAALVAASGWLLAGCAQAAPRKTVVSDDATPDAVTYGRRDDLMAWGLDVAERRGFSREWTQDLLAQARLVPQVKRLIAPPPSGAAKNWAAYRARFVEQVRIRAGVAFWRDNDRTLAQAEERFGVPAAMVVGIVGVETLYGRHMGTFRVIDALTTLGFDYPKDAPRDRSPFFRSELEALLAMGNAGTVDVLALKGSYAGAMGMPQFMPSSWGKYAIDFDGDGRIDLHASTSDVIGSVANYLAAFGWRRGAATHFTVAPPIETADRAVLLGPDILPSFSAAEFTQRGAALEAAGREYDGKLALVELQNGDATPSYVAGTENFYAITRYNQSSYYALAVIELGRAVEAIVDATR